MEAEKLNKYLIKEILRSLKTENEWQIKGYSDSIIVNGKSENINRLFNCGFESSILCNPGLKLFFNFNINKSFLEKVLIDGEDNDIRFKFDPIEEISELNYWKEEHNHRIVRNKIFLKLNFIQRIRLKKALKGNLKRYYDRTYLKSYRESLTSYMEDNKSIFRDQRLSEILDK